MKRMQEQAERVERLTNSPAMKRMQEQAERVERLTNSPAMKRMQEQAERVERLTNSPAMKRLNKQAELVERLTTSPAMERLQKRVEEVARLTASPWMDRMQKQAGQVARLNMPALVNGLDAQLTEAAERALRVIDALPETDLEDGLAGAARDDGAMPVDLMADIVAVIVSLWLFGWWVSEIDRTGESLVKMNAVEVIQNIGWCLAAGLAARAAARKLDRPVSGDE
jgi:hypothetical protein